MENYFTTEELLIIINKCREIEDLTDYHINQLYEDIENDEIQDDNKISIIEAVGLFAYQTHFVRFLATKEILKKEYYTVNEFCKENNLDVDYGEIITLSKLCQKISDKEEKVVKKTAKKSTPKKVETKKSASKGKKTDL